MTRNKTKLIAKYYLDTRTTCIHCGAKLPRLARKTCLECKHETHTATTDYAKNKNYTYGRKCVLCERPIKNTNKSGLCVECYNTREIRSAYRKNKRIAEKNCKKKS